MNAMFAVLANPHLMTEAAANLATIGSTLDAAHLNAAISTQSVLPAAADEVSAGVAHLFSGYASDYHQLADRVARYQRDFVAQLTAAADAYAGAEAASASTLQGTLTAAAAAVAVPSLDQLLSSLMSNLTALFWNSIAGLYYLLFLLLIPIYAALVIYLPFAFLGSLFPI